ncbi:sensor histidine kinase [Eudoraea chungangensis]|uniref:sensor histidine kinase n=1 Tax=Eudoraea chungangensis TaxID=1481905 RepID=UPI0023EC4B26|nr:histidine kinase [Eudoraea chungangensis]
MQLSNKEKRIKYLGFNDVWFVTGGILVLSFITDFLFSNNSFARYPFWEATINWSVSLMFSTVNWLVMRKVIIALRKKYPRLKDNRIRIPLIFLALVSSILIIDFIGNNLLGYIFDESYNHPLRSKIVLPIILISTMTMAIYEALYYYIRLKESIREEEQAKRAIVQSQLDALRNQAQPHFFFNTLNTLRDIIDQNTKEEAKEFVNRLSEVYRFILESGNSNVISLRDELKFAEAYIHIQKERFGNNLRIQWNIKEGDKNSLIIPMSLQLLLENAVKHNVISKAKPLEVHVEVSEGKLIVHNKITQKSTQLPTTKLGLSNIGRRYKLIADEEIVISKKGGTFKVSLPLLTAENQILDYADIDH